ncbi:uncharacterized protein L969DRAFT_96359 [Mixia osmundae IAM 14324]|uniref:Probable proteasome subunit beta type-4 n=1 Tax=Mixia osmundae (strain CBS 9802 / IAM 14324 / JCM 22182 / KY 12970) TaxID=764103 RepID=G7DUY7_MIXOS|nr:uncharacterized protein L969DRAFT_96359 [Mixia osmundae IAM 14324]KEI37273.1 hypothetical protein L969DRAFT_96359 [Mixia osmundae IAM 14324]GAA94397.1 hypothetical protein E5Q_01048 [Mixia osmundae IAM 14324]
MHGNDDGVAARNFEKTRTSTATKGLISERQISLQVQQHATSFVQAAADSISQASEQMCRSSFARQWASSAQRDLGERGETALLAGEEVGTDAPSRSWRVVLVADFATGLQEIVSCSVPPTSWHPMSKHHSTHGPGKQVLWSGVRITRRRHQRISDHPSRIKRREQALDLAVEHEHQDNHGEFVTRQLVNTLRHNDERWEEYMPKYEGTFLYLSAAYGFASGLYALLRDAWYADSTDWQLICNDTVWQMSDNPDRPRLNCRVRSQTQTRYIQAGAEHDSRERSRESLKKRVRETCNTATINCSWGAFFRGGDRAGECFEFHRVCGSRLPQRPLDDPSSASGQRRIRLHDPSSPSGQKRIRVRLMSAEPTALENASKSSPVFDMISVHRSELVCRSYLTGKRSIYSRRTMVYAAPFSHASELYAYAVRHTYWCCPPGRDKMECSFGITGKDFTIIASDTSAARSIVRMKSNEDKMRVIGKRLVFAYSGESGDTVQFAEYVEANLKLNAIRNHTELRPAASAAWIRKTLADSLRSRKPYQVNLLLGGFDPTDSTPHLYWIDYLGTKATVPYAAHGYGSYFCLSTMDRYHNPNCSLEEGLALLARCINELETRFIVNLGKFQVRVVDKDGVREVELPAHAPAAPVPSTTLDTAPQVAVSA